MAFIRGTYIWVPVPGQISGGLIVWEIISGGLISGGLYPRTNIRGLISGGFISVAYIPVYRFFKATVDKFPLKRLYVPELEKKTVVVSIRRAALLKGRSSGAILRLPRMGKTRFGIFWHVWRSTKNHSRLNEGV